MAQVIAKNTTVDGANFRFERADGAFLEMPVDTAMMERGTTKRFNVSPRLRSDGGIEIGDGTTDARKYQMHYNMWSTDNQSFRDSLNEVDSFFDPRQTPFILRLDDDGIQGRVTIMKNTIAHNKGLRDRKADGTLELILTDGLWESQDVIGFPGGTGSETGDTPTGGTGGSEKGVGPLVQNDDNVTLNNASLFNVFPTLFIVAQDNVVNFSLTNQTTGAGFTFDSNDFTSGTELIADFSRTRSSVFALEGVEKSAAVTNGGPFFLVPGDNTILYESDNGDILFEAIWRLRFAF